MFSQAVPAPVSPPALHLYLMRMLDEIDYGLVLLDITGNIWHANHLGRAELGRGVWIHAKGGQLDTCITAQQDALQRAIKRAGEGVRSLLSLRHLDREDPGTCIAFVPMGHPAEAYPNPLPVLAITCRQVLCERISLHFFAQSYGITTAEEGVLLLMSQGKSLEEIAVERGLVLSTVRTHVRQLRVKTQCTSVRDLMAKVSLLPPVVSSIKTF